MIYSDLTTFRNVHFFIDDHDSYLFQELEVEFEALCNPDPDIDPDIDYRNHDCLIIVIMSHGKKKIFYTKDGQYLYISEVVRKFSKVSSLHGKPKLVFINTCQGSKYN